MRLLARAGVLTGSTLLAMAAPIAPLLAAAGSGTLTTKPSVEAWYRTSPACATPLPCAAAPTPYPAGTFHVGVTLGTEDSRSYLQLDLTALPAGTKPTGGQLRLPLAPAGDGTSSPETAKLRACLAPQAVKPADGTATSEPPKVDCEAASVDAVLVPAAGNVPAAFTVDLADLATAWQSAGAPGALALLPGKVAPSDRWQLAFSDQSRQGAGLVKPTAAVSYTGATVDTSALPPPLVTAPVQEAPPLEAASGSSGNLAAGTSPDLNAPPPAAVAQAPIVAGRQQPAVVPQQRVAPVAFTAGGFRYPGVFLLPLLFAVAVAWLGRALTRDLRSN